MLSYFILLFVIRFYPLNPPKGGLKSFVFLSPFLPTFAFLSQFSPPLYFPQKEKITLDFAAILLNSRMDFLPPWGEIPL
jgi:hypothetical protein